jgi:hypothetical protein
MKYNIPPKVIKYNGKTYTLETTDHNDDDFKGWWSYCYKDKNGLIPQATDGKSVYYLCSMNQSKKESEDDMLERINTMIKIVDEKKPYKNKKKKMNL